LPDGRTTPATIELSSVKMALVNVQIEVKLATPVAGYAPSIRSMSASGELRDWRVDRSQSIDFMEGLIEPGDRLVTFQLAMIPWRKFDFVAKASGIPD